MAKPIEGYSTGLSSALASGSKLTDTVLSTPPETRSVDLDYLQQMARREALINALESRGIERQVSPELAAAREELPRQINAELQGGPSTTLSNIWTKAGLVDAVATGVNTGSGFARSALADSTRRDFILDRDRVQGKAASLLAANPAPVAGLDPGSMASAITQTQSDNANARDLYKTSVLSALSNNSNNVFNAFQQSAQLEAARRSGNAQAANAVAGANAASSGATTGSLIGAGGAVAGGLLLF